jgi:hypothetical protein
VILLFESDSTTAQKNQPRNAGNSSATEASSNSVTNASKCLGATSLRSRVETWSLVKMPLHYHNQIVKDRTANSLLELAKHSLYQSVRIVSTPKRRSPQNIFSRLAYPRFTGVSPDRTSFAGTRSRRIVKSEFELYRQRNALQPIGKQVF